MELSFEKKQVSYLKRILQKVQEQEELSETVVPDSYPDILSVIDAYAEPMIRGKECREGGVIVSGAVQGGILYLPDDHSFARHLDFYIPFSIKADAPALTEHSQVQCSVRVRTVDGSAVNSRKAMLRVSLECMISAFEETTETFSVLQDVPDCLEIRQAAYEIQLPLETAEKSFSMQDTLEIPMDLPPIDHICRIGNRIMVRDQKLVGNKAVFKGTVECSMLYLGEDAQYHTCHKSMPFSQYCELQHEFDRELLELLPVLTGCNWETSGGAESREVHITINLLVQCIVFGCKKLEFVEDAYCIGGTLTPEWTDYQFDSCLDHETYHQVLRKIQDQSFEKILDTSVYTGYPRSEINNGIARITTPIQIHLLGYGEEKELSAVYFKTEDVKELSSNEDCKILPNLSFIGNPESLITATGTETTCELCLTVSCYAAQCFKQLTGSTLELNNSTEGDRPSLILKSVTEGTSLWQIAKQYGTREEAIRMANHLDIPVLDHTQNILIPIA